MRSRPCRVARTRPTSPMARRCLVTACRVTPDPSLKFEIESGPSALRRATSFTRVASPSAAKIGAASASLSAAELRPRDIALDVLDLAGPAVVVHAERFGAARQRNLVESGLGDGERGP